MNVDVQLRDDVIGLTLEEFFYQGYTNYRVVEANGESFAILHDFDTERINLVTHNNIIIDAYYG
jgi:hypothetical protein